MFENFKTFVFLVSLLFVLTVIIDVNTEYNTITECNYCYYYHYCIVIICCSSKYGSMWLSLG